MEGKALTITLINDLIKSYERSFANESSNIIIPSKINKYPGK
jgi:hypothetical protein